MTTAWLLNLDADLEYARGDSYHRSPAMRRRIKAWSRRILGLPAKGDTLLPLEGPWVSEPGAALSRPEFRRILCWSPTPSALTQLRTLGLIPPKAPSLAVLRRVNAKEWVSPLGLGLAGGRLLGAMAEAQAVLARPSPSGAWRLKERFGFAGRGQRTVTGSLEPGDFRWIEARIAEDGGLWVEPEALVLDAFALHGWVSPEGALRLGRLVRQRIGPRGCWEGAELALGPEDEMRNAASLVAERLREEGYFGPFGIDGIAWKMGALEGFTPVLECNARLTMAFGLGFPPEGIPEIS